MARKTLKQEIDVVRYMTALLPKHFQLIERMYDSDSETDKKWAAEQMSKLYAKAVPQKIGGDPDNRTPIPLLYALHNNNGNPKDIQAP